MPRPCIKCGAPRDRQYAYTTSQGKRSVRYDSRCSSCNSVRRKARYANQRDKELSRMKAWHEENRDTRLLTMKAWREANRERRAYLQRLRKARIRSGQRDDPDIRAIYLQAQHENELIKNCPLFKLRELGPLQVDHIIPLSKGGQHVASNLQILPLGINMRKGVSCPK